MSLEQQSQHGVFDNLRRPPEPKQPAEHNKWVEMPQAEFDATVNNLQNFPVEGEEDTDKKGKMRNYVRAAALIGIPLGLAIAYAAQGFRA